MLPIFCCYLSHSDGFLQAKDLDYLHECLKSLRPVKKKGANNLGKLRNLFIIASRAGAVNNGNSTELKEILDRRCKALCDSYALAASNAKKNTLLPFRSIQTGYDYTEEDFRKDSSHTKKVCQGCAKNSIRHLQLLWKNYLYLCTGIFMMLLAKWLNPPAMLFRVEYMSGTAYLLSWKTEENFVFRLLR